MRALPRQNRILLLAAALLATGQPALAAGSFREFRLCLFGDTQGYVSHDWVEAKRRAYASQVEYAVAGNCDAVLHMGDVTWSYARQSHEEAAPQWRRTKEILQPLRDSGVLFSPAQGNHDVVSQYASLLRWWQQGGQTFTAISGSGRSHALVAPIGGVEHLVVSVGCGWARAELEFLKEQLAKHPGLPTIVQNHTAVGGGRTPKLILRDPRYAKRTCPFDVSGFETPTEEEIRGVLRGANQIYLVAGGHFWTNAAGLDEVRSEAHPLLLITQDTGKKPNSGDGWIGLLTVDPGSGRARFEQYSHAKRMWARSGPLGARTEFDLAWGQRGFPQVEGPRVSHRRPPPRRGGWLSHAGCLAAFFTNRALDGENECEKADRSRIALLPGGKSSYATKDPALLPVGSPPDSTAHWHANRDRSPANLRPSTRAWRQLPDPETGFACFWTRTPKYATYRTAKEFRWVDGSKNGRGFRVEAIYFDETTPDGTTRFHFGDGSFDARKGLEIPFRSIHHVCLGWQRQENAPDSWKLSATLNGADACPEGGCPAAGGGPIARENLRLGLQTSKETDGRLPTSGGDHSLYEFVVVGDVPLTLARARWIVACGAAGRADASARIEAYLGGEAGELLGPNGETSCPGAS